MVSSTHQTRLGAARLAFRSCLDGPLCPDRGHVRLRHIPIHQKTNSVYHFFAVPAQHCLQPAIHAHPVRTANNLLAAADILLVLGTLVWALLAIYPQASWIVYANLPYLLWVAFCHGSAIDDYLFKLGEIKKIIR